MQQYTKLLRIALTAGEPAGIGPDIVLKIATENFKAELIVIAAKELLLERAAQLQIPINLHDYDAKKIRHHQPNHLSIIHVPLHNTCKPGHLDISNSLYVMETLRLAAQGCLDNEFDAVVTAPVQKSVINEAGISFTGHTEFFAEFSKTEYTVMLLTTKNLRIALLTTHLPLSKVSAAITPEKLEKTIKVLHSALQQKFNIPSPKIFVAGLNPHAGENGQLGKEEIEIINPTLERLRHEGMLLYGALPADTLFLPQNLQKADVFLTMYHDQGLPVIKFYDFATTVNITLGLPFVRTSVDHGTALELAGTGKADPRSLSAAIKLAIEILS